MNTETSEKTIADVLRAMEIGDEATFPIERTPYIRGALLYRDLIAERRAGCRWSSITDMENGIVIVKRIA